MLLSQEFQLEIKDKPGAENLVAEHLSRLETGGRGGPFSDCFPDETLYAVSSRLPCYAVVMNYIVTTTFPIDLSRAEKEKIRAQSKYYVWDEPYLWKFCGDKITRRCIDDSEIHSILTFIHYSESRGPFGPKRTAHKILECRFIGPLFLVMLMIFVKDVKHAKRLEIYQE